MNKLNVGDPGAQDANPDVSGKSVEGADRLMQLVESLATEVKNVKSEIGGIYSRQDKDRNAFGEFMDEFRRFKGQGLSDAAAETAAERSVNNRTASDEQAKMLKEIHEKLYTPQGSGTVDAAGILEKAGLDMNDPEVIVLKSRSYKSEAEVLQAIGQHYVKKSNQPNLNPAQETSSIRAASPAPKQQDLIDELNRLYMSADATPAQIRDLENKLGWT